MMPGIGHLPFTATLSLWTLEEQSLSPFGESFLGPQRLTMSSLPEPGGARYTPRMLCSGRTVPCLERG